MRSASVESFIPGRGGKNPPSTAEAEDELLDELNNEPGGGLPILMYHRIAQTVRWT